ncbi:MAG: cystatin domain-containing protein [Syntrophobacteraceae bacterium]|nr:cystatin domain-containing protein [Syntrophobacteraceae bacterium]
MKRIAVLASLFFAMLGLAVTLAAQPMPAGGYSAVSANRKDVRSAAAYAIRAETKALQEQKDGRATGLKLVQIITAEKQVVAGMNYRLKLQVKANGKIREAEAVVWWQAWRKPAPYMLTSWKWVEM